MTVAIVEGDGINGEDLLAVAQFGDDEQLAALELGGDVRRPDAAVGGRRRRCAQVEDQSVGLPRPHEQRHVQRVGQRQSFLRRDRHRHQARRRVFVAECRRSVACPNKSIIHYLLRNNRLKKNNKTLMYLSVVYHTVSSFYTHVHFTVHELSWFLCIFVEV